MPLIGVSANSLVPLYRQISDQLLRCIVNGEIVAGQSLPTEYELCEEFGVSRITVRKALDELVERQVIYRRRGVGTFVNEGSQSGWSVTLTGVIEDLITPNDLDIVREGNVVVPADVQQFAKLPEGTELKVFEGVNHLADRVPLVHVCFYYPQEIAERLSVEALSGPMQAIKVVEQLVGCGVDHAKQIVMPTIAMGSIAKSLEIAEGTAALRAIRVYFDRQLKLIEIFDATYHPTRYRYTATLYPRTGPARGL